MSDLLDKAKNIRLLILNVDGVLTNGGLQFNANSHEYKIFNSLDAKQASYLQ